MNDQGNPSKDSSSQTRGPLFEATRRILLAAIGAAAFAQDEAEEFIAKLVERGEIAEKDGKRLVQEMMEKRKMHRTNIEAEVGKRFNDSMSRFNLPTKKDFDDLSAKIADLAQKVDELSKNQS